MDGQSFCFQVTLSVLITGVEKLMRTYSGNPSFSNQKNLEETEQQLDEVKNCVFVWLCVRGDTRHTPGVVIDVLSLPVVLSQTGSPGGHSLQAVCGAVWITRNTQTFSPLQKKHREMERQGEITQTYVMQIHRVHRGMLEGETACWRTSQMLQDS